MAETEIRVTEIHTTQTWHNIKFLVNININIFRNLVFKININIKILQKNSSISKSISISKFSHPQYQNQYQNFSKPRINIKININIVKILVLILKIKIFWGLKIWFLTSSDLCRLGPMGFHLIPIAPKHGTLGPSLGPKGPNQRPMVPHLWTPLAQNYYCANSIKPWDPTRNLLYLTNELGDSKKGPLESFQGDAVDT